MTKKTFTKLLSVALVVLLAGAGITAGAAPSKPQVVFDVSSKEFTMNMPAYGDEKYPDLFPSMKDMMPGDEASEKINIRVDNAGDKTVKMYLTAENQNADYDALLDEGAKITTTIKGKDGALNDLSGLLTKLHNVLKGSRNAKEKTYTNATGMVYLGAYTASDNQDTIDVKLTIPKEAGNALNGAEAMIDWVFIAEVIEPTTPNPPTPPTPPGPGGGGGGPIGPTKPELVKDDHFAYIVGYEGDRVRPTAPITRAETATIFFRMLTDESRTKYWSTSCTFWDVPATAWYNNAISTLENCGIVDGYTDGSFMPDEPITRAEFAAMAVRFFNVKGDGTQYFDDVEGHWAEDEINAAASIGLIEGYGDGTFRPQRDISRAEAMTLMNNVLERDPVTTQLLPGMIEWVDNMNTETWYYAEVQEATNSHDFERAADGTEIWTKLLPVRDWEAFETTWSNANSASNPGNVYKSNTID